MTGSFGEPVPRVHLRILATSDLHAHLLPFDYYTDRRDDAVGLLRVAGLIAAARAEAANTLFLDNGDTLQGAPLGDAAVAELLARGQAHPMIAALNALGCDAATLGNHDFDFGYETLQRALAAARYPVVLANAAPRDGSAPPWVARHLLHRQVTDAAGGRHALAIGVTGVAPPQIEDWNRGVLHDRVAVGDICAAARAEAAALRAAGADLVVVLAHSGLGPGGPPAPGAENAAAAVAALDGVDAVVAGHSHDVHPPHPAREGAAAALVQPGALGSHLGVIDLALAPPASPGARWRVAASRSLAAPVAGLARPAPGALLRRALRAAPDLRAPVILGHRGTRAFTARPIGTAAVALETYFSRVAPCAATQLVAEAQRRAVAPRLARDPGLAALPLVSVVAPFRSGGRGGPGNYTDIPPGPLRLRHAADLYIYPNQLSLLKITGADLAEWLERAASGFHRVDPAGPADQPLIDHAFAGYNFDRFEGLRYEIDVSRPPRTNAEGDAVYDTPPRVRDLRCADGRPVAPGDSLLVITNSYRAGGGGHVPAAARAELVETAAQTVREAVIRHVAAAPAPLAPVPAPTWRFSGLGGVAVRVETGPGAAAHAARAAALGLVPRPGPAPTPGYAAYTLRL